MLDLIDRALAEDLGEGDLTTDAVVPPGARARARIEQKEPGVPAGLRVAEELVYDVPTTGAESDMQQVTGLARGMVERWGMSEKVGFLAVAPRDGAGPLLPGADPVSEATKELIDAEVRRIVDEELEVVEQLLSDNRERLDSLAEALLERETLDEPHAYAAAGIDRAAAPASS